jgi:hypothetical protein
MSKNALTLIAAFAAFTLIVIAVIGPRIYISQARIVTNEDGTYTCTVYPSGEQFTSDNLDDAKLFAKNHSIANEYVKFYDVNCTMIPP